MMRLLVVVLLLMIVSIPAHSAGLVCQQGADQVPAAYQSADGRKLQACFDLKQQRVTVRLPGGAQVQLPVAVSGSGARYSDGTRTFWEHQGMGRYFEGETLLFEGAVTDQPPAKGAVH
jgi:membrane-bound inhibitor of C-type lysozyme